MRHDRLDSLLFILSILCILVKNNFYKARQDVQDFLKKGDPYFCVTELLTQFGRRTIGSVSLGTGV